MKYALLLSVIFAFTLSGAFAEPVVMLDKQSYTEGDTITVSGKVQYEPGIFIVIQLRSQTDIVGIDQIFPGKSGSFSTSFEADGPKWQESGVYTVRMSYLGQTVEKSFQYSKSVTPEQTKNADAPSQTQQPQVKPKITIRGFPDSKQPPQHYFDRYESELEFRAWFDTTFKGFTIQEVVGYRPTHIVGFPDSQYSPQHYIERYTNESVFREWFDSQFPEKTIYDIVGVPEEVKILAPSWVKQYSRWWASGTIDDAQFASRISELIKQNIIIIEGNIAILESGENTIPSWFKNNARWYSDGHITEDDFLRGIEYLVENQIIII